MKTTILFLFLIFVFAFNSKCDEVIEGTKNISYNIEFTNIDTYPDYIFIAYPVNNSRGVPQIQAVKLEQNKELYLACKYGGTVIYAIKKELLNEGDIKFGAIFSGDEIKKTDSFFTKNKNMIPSEEVYCNSQVDKSEPYASVTDYYKIESVTADTMIIKREKIIRKDENGKILEEIKGDFKGDVLGGSRKNTAAYLIFYSLPFLAIIAIVVFVVVRKKKK